MMTLISSSFTSCFSAILVVDPSEHISATCFSMKFLCNKKLTTAQHPGLIQKACRYSICSQISGLFKGLEDEAPTSFWIHLLRSCKQRSNP